jgi:hypothetical protein
MGIVICEIAEMIPLEGALKVTNLAKRYATQVTRIKKFSLSQLYVPIRSKGQTMILENIRYYVVVTLMVLGCSGLPTGIIVFGIRKIIEIDENNLDIAYLITYIILVVCGLRIYLPRMRGVI